MTPAEHAAADAALKARRAGQGLHGHSHGPAPTSQASRIAALVIWLLAIGTLAALFWTNRAG
jgi:hypothetical protein